MKTGRRHCWAALTAALLPAAAIAQSRLTPDAFLDAVVGKTVTFYNLSGDKLVGTEQFLSRTLSVWQRPGGDCVYGRITTPDGQVCFRYDDRRELSPTCWWPFKHEGRLLVRVARLGDGEIQRVGNMTKDGLNCPSAPIS